MLKKVLFGFIFLLFIFSVSSQNIDFDALQTGFTADTVRINQQVRDKLNTDYTTLGMIEASNFSEQEYDKLLNKYYKILYNALNDEGKKSLRATQLNWIKLRDSDKELVSAMRNQIYDEMGGGTIWGIVAADARADITRRRVVELFNFIQFSDIGGR